ncbi:hypothetical protein V7x_52850 [Crateriforma conspicua]|uniref:Protein kinase domain-containing protein n=1 Tax=Crateriforma conspicua TaxID=2527996 RepID=A0A5C6FLJ3_9PLAN|nr:hypothetical protein [Crateriforma conspicua]TWU60974.1 hypothetical protein V7x_52850 [Crateriforma conspicua]
MPNDLTQFWTDRARLYALRSGSKDADAEPLVRQVPDGRVLADALDQPDRSFDRKTLLRLAHTVARGLQTIHRWNRPHGGITARRVWMTSDGRFALLVDVRSDDDLSMPDRSVDIGSTAVDTAAAPTDALPRDLRDASASRDFLDLGRLIVRLRYPQAWPGLVDGRDIPEIAKAVRLGEKGDPLDRIVAHLLAPNPDARFTSADALVQAIRAAAKTSSEGSSDAAPKPPKTVAPSPQVVPQTEATPISAPERPAVVDAIRDEPEPTNQDQAAPVAVDPKETVIPTTRRSPTSSTRRRGRSRRRSPVPILLGMLAIPLLCLCIVLVWQSSQPDPGDRSAARPRVSPDFVPPVINRSTARSGNNSDATPGNEGADSELFAPPRPTETAFRLDGLPPGPGMLIHLRPADWMSDPDGQAVIKALSPELSGAVDDLAARTGRAAQEIASLTIALHPGDSGRPEMTWAVDLATPVNRQTWIEQLGLSLSMTATGKKIYSGDDPDSDAYYIPEHDDVSMLSQFTVGSVPMVSEVAEIDGLAISLPRNLQSVWQHCDQTQSLSVVLTPNFLFTDARQWVRRVAPSGLTELARWMVPSVSGVAVTIDLRGDDVYWVTRWSPAGGTNEATLLSQVRRRMDQLPATAEDFLIRSQPEVSWKALAIRLPRMWDFLLRHTRFGLKDRQAVAGGYLPKHTLDQIVLANLLALRTPDSVPAIDTASPPKQSLSLSELLQRPMSISFDQESLESAIDVIREEFARDLPAGTDAPVIEIKGNDLRLMGITQNQQIRDFQIDRLPLADVLTRLVLSANPDRTATGPTDPKQTLIWIATSDSQKILITTRESAGNYQRIPDPTFGDL